MLCSPLICLGSVFFVRSVCVNIEVGGMGGGTHADRGPLGKIVCIDLLQEYVTPTDSASTLYNYFQSDPLKWKVCFANRRQKRRHNQKPTCERLAILGSPSPLPLPFQTSSLSQPPGARRHVSSSPRPCVPNNCATCTGQCVEILQFLI